MNTSIHWVQSKQFSGKNNGLPDIHIDAPSDHGGDPAGVSPKVLLLDALAGCTGIDVVSILEKMRIKFTSFNIEVEGEQTDTHPKVFSTICIKYIFEGTNEREKVERAVKLSMENYCGISAMLSKTAKIDYEIVLK